MGLIINYHLLHKARIRPAIVARFSTKASAAVFAALREKTLYLLCTHIKHELNPKNIYLLILMSFLQLTSDLKRRLALQLTRVHVKG